MGKGCNCFFCRNGENYNMLFGYLMADANSYIHFLNVFSDMGIKVGSLTDKDLSGEMAALDWNLMETICYLNEIVNKMGDKLSKENKEDFEKTAKRADAVYKKIRG